MTTVPVVSIATRYQIRGSFCARTDSTWAQSCSNAASLTSQILTAQRQRGELRRDPRGRTEAARPAGAQGLRGIRGGPVICLIRSCWSLRRCSEVA
jgi:hypothetical protein